VVGLAMLACSHQPQLLPDPVAEESSTGPYAVVLGQARGDVERILADAGVKGGCAPQATASQTVLALSPALRIPREEYQLPVRLGRTLNPDSAAYFVRRGFVDRLCQPAESGLCEDPAATTNLSLSETRDEGSMFTGIDLLLTRPYYCPGDDMLFAVQIQYLLQPDSAKGTWKLEGSSSRMVN
jgi:hypothetical protein